MSDQNQPNQPPDELTPGFWQTWREQEGNTPRLAHLLLQRGRQLLDRFHHFHTALSTLPFPAQRRWQRNLRLSSGRSLGVSLAGAALALALSGASVAYALPPSGNALLNGTSCDLIEAINVANTGTSTVTCPATVSGADTITLLSDVTLYSDQGNNAVLPAITSPITIAGSGYTIDGNDNGLKILFVTAGGNLTLNDTTITGGSGTLAGAIHNEGGTVTLNNSTVSGNRADAGDFHIGNGISNRGGMLTLNNSTVSSNFGAGYTAIGNSLGGTVILSNSTISGNSGSYGGGISNIGGTVSLSNSTITGNTASTGGGIFNNGGVLTLERSLVSGNTAASGQEVYNYTGGCLNAAAADTPTCLASASVINAVDSNLFGHSGENNFQAFVGFAPDADDIVATSDGNLATPLSAILNTTLQVNAPGNTATHALVAGSPAIDAASAGPATDQRGVSRPQGAGFDIGAFELEQASNQAPVIAANNASVTVDEGQTASNSGTVSDPDGDPVTLSASVGTIVNNGNGTWSWNYTPSSPGGQAVTIAADDGNGGASETSFILYVTSPAACAVVAWGWNNNGQATTPASLSAVTAIAAGGFHSLALKADGTVVGWGNNGSGQATPPVGLSNVVAIGAGASHSLALKADGTVVGWGNNGSGQATPPVGLNDVIAIAAGASHSLALKADGTVVGWGSNSAGQATPPVGLSDVTAIAAGGTHSLALKTDGTVVGWGSNSAGQATPPVGLSAVTAIAAGFQHSLALKADGTVVGWGNNSSGQASPPASLSNVTAIAAATAGSHSLALNADGTVVGWGDDGFGQLNIPADLSNVTAIAAGQGHSLAAISQCAPANQAPVIAANNASVMVDEGQTAVTSGTVSDTDGDTVALIASVGTIVNNGDGTWSWSLTTTDGPASQTVTITADDGHGGTAQTTFGLTVNNVAPTINNVSNNGPIVAGGLVNITVAATDPAGAADPLSYAFDCDNNGSFEVGPQAGNGTTCNFASAGTFSVNIQVSDGDGGVTPGSTVVTVNATTTPVGNCGGYAVVQTPGGGFSAPGWSGNIIVGDNGWNLIFGTNNADLILGRGGPDDIFGLKGNDVICGGDGIDILVGGDGNDTLFGDQHPDWLIGGSGNDTLRGGEGWDDLEGNDGQDALYGENGFDVLLGGNQNDTLDGGNDADYLEGGSGADTMVGGAGPDALYGGNDNDNLAGNDGNDLLYGNNGSDTLNGGANTDLCQGGPGSDTITACESGSASAVDDDDAAGDKAGEPDPLQLNDDNGANTIEWRVQQIYLPLVSR